MLLVRSKTGTSESSSGVYSSSSAFYFLYQLTEWHVVAAVIVVLARLSRRHHETPHPLRVFAPRNFDFAAFGSLTLESLNVEANLILLSLFFVSIARLVFVVIVSARSPRNPTPPLRVKGINTHVKHRLVKIWREVNVRICSRVPGRRRAATQGIPGNAASRGGGGTSQLHIFMWQSSTFR